MKYALILAMVLMACGNKPPKSDSLQRAAQEKILAEGTSQVGMPAIKNFRERKLLKDIIELRDQSGLITFTYLQSEMTGKLVFLGESVGYGIPAATQFTSPEKPETYGQGGIAGLPQADPNGLFSPSSAEGTWVMLKDPNGPDVKPLYVEPRIVVSPFRLSVE